MANKKEHWEKVYLTRQDNEVGWFQENPTTSLNLVQKYAKDKKGPIIDIGAGNSFLIKKLFELGFEDLTVLDISRAAIERSKSRFANLKNEISWIEKDVLSFTATGLFKVWHDRAVFHFLTRPKEISTYAEVAAANIEKDGYLILGTFSETGPVSCSGLPIVQYSAESFTKVFESNFRLIECFDDVHITPSGNAQNFIWVVFRRL